MSVLANNDKQLNIKIIPPQEYLPYVFAVLGLVLIVFLGVLAYNAIKENKYIGKSAEYRNTINVSGQGKVLIKPDIGQVDLAVVTEVSTVAKAVSDNNQKMNKIIQAMKGLGVSENDLKTVIYNINPKYQYTSGRSSIIGYEVNQTLQVKIRDLDKTSQVLEKAAELGANQVGSLSFTIDDPEKIKEEARQKAIENAKKKAGEMEKSLGIKLGKIVGFDESSDSTVPPVYYGVDGRGGGAEVPAPQIQAGQNEVVVTVNLMYEVK